MIQRTLTAIVLLAIVVGALFLDPTGWAVKILIVLVGLGVCFELSRILNIKDRFLEWQAIVVLLLAVPGGYEFPRWWLFVAVGIISPPLLVFSVKNKSQWANIAISTAWVCATLVCVYLLASTKSPSTWPLLMTAAIPIWCGDTAAIFVGKAFGKHKMAPSISPNKTWEGGIGNLLACVGAALVLGAIFHYPMLLMVLLGLNCGIIGQAGDLFESWLKRKADVKDSGNILPGHGGLLDRLDSLMATAPISLLILSSFVAPGKP